MDEVTRDIQEDIPWCMLFADDVVLVDDSRTGVNRKFYGDKPWNWKGLDLVELKPSTWCAVLVLLGMRRRGWWAHDASEGHLSIFGVNAVGGWRYWWRCEPSNQSRMDEVASSFWHSLWQESATKAKRQVLQRWFDMQYCMALSVGRLKGIYLSYPCWRFLAQIWDRERDTWGRRINQRDKG